MSTPEFTPEVTILMPKISDIQRTMRRYSGLLNELQERDIEAVMVQDHKSYVDGEFTNGMTPEDWNAEGFITKFGQTGAFKPQVVRDLTMPTDDKPIYHDPDVTLVHQPAFNNFVRDKYRVSQLFSPLQPKTVKADNKAAALDVLADSTGSAVVVKPVTGSAGDGVLVGAKEEVVAQLAESNSDYAQEATYPVIVQEFLESKPGIPELGIEGRHNFRVIMIGGAAIFGFERAVRDGEWKVDGDSWDHLVFHDPERFPADLQIAIDYLRDGLAELPDGLQTVVAADFMRGYVGTPEDTQMYLCELNRRPLRNSRYDGNYPNLLWAASQWDKHEADLLAAKVGTL